MRLIATIVLLSIACACLQGCRTTHEPDRSVYAWFTYGTVPRDSLGRIKGVTQWQNTHSMEDPGDIFMFYGNNDSIRMKVPKGNDRILFKRTTIHSRKWKPAEKYGDSLFLMGTYTRDSLPGFYFSFYTTKDRSSLMQLLYTNPGSLSDILFFSRDSVNILKVYGITIDPKDEEAEPEQAQIESK